MPASARSSSVRRAVIAARISGTAGRYPTAMRVANASSSRSGIVARAEGARGTLSAVRATSTSVVPMV